MKPKGYRCIPMNELESCTHCGKTSPPSDLEYPESLKIPADRIPWLRRCLLNYISFNQVWVSGSLPPEYYEKEPPSPSSYEDEMKIAEKMLRAINGIGLPDLDIAQGTSDYWVMIPTTFEQKQWLKDWLFFNLDQPNYDDARTVIDAKGDLDMINYFLKIIDISLRDD
jgi:hypothetical protein